MPSLGTLRRSKMSCRISPREGVSLQNVMDMRQFVLAAIFRDDVRSVPARSSTPLRGHLVPSAPPRSLIARGREKEKLDSFNNCKLRLLQEELSHVRRTLRDAEAERDLLIRNIQGNVRTGDDFEEESSAPTATLSSSRDVDVLYHENVLLKSKVRRWKSLHRAAQCTKNKFRKQISALQREVRLLKLSSNNNNSLQSQIQSQIWEEKFTQLQLQISQVEQRLSRREDDRMPESIVPDHATPSLQTEFTVAEGTTTQKRRLAEVESAQSRYVCVCVHFSFLHTWF